MRLANSLTKKKKKKKKRSTLEASNSFVTGFPGLLREPRFSGHINTFYTFNGYFGVENTLTLATSVQNLHRNASDLDPKYPLLGVDLDNNSDDLLIKKPILILDFSLL